MKLKSEEVVVPKNNVNSIETKRTKKGKEKHKKKEKKTQKSVVANSHIDTNGDCDVDSIKEFVKNERSNRMKIDLESLKESTKSENAFVKRLIDTIPKAVYFKSNNLNQIREEKHAKAQEKLEDIGLKRKVDKLSKSVRNKRSKLDPQQQKSVTDLQEELSTPKTTNRTIQPSNSQQHSIDVLRQRLQAKLASLRSSRQGAKSVDIVEKKRLKKQMIAAKKKDKKKLAKEQGPTIKTLVKMEKETPALAVTTVLPTKPVFNKEGKMVFSKFDFSENGGNHQSRKKGEYAGKDYKSLLNKLERDKEKFAKLKATDEEKAKRVQEKNLWKNAIDKAEGVKVKQDEELLKKALKRKEYKKKKSKKGWKERDGMVKKNMAEKQKKRDRNIQARKEDKKKHRMKRGAKKGRLQPNAL